MPDYLSTLRDYGSRAVSGIKHGAEKAANYFTAPAATPTRPLTGRTRPVAPATKVRGPGGTLSRYPGGKTFLVGDALNLANQGASIAQGEFDPSVGNVVGGIGSIARLASLNPAVSNYNGAGAGLLRGARNPNTALVALGAQETLPHLPELWNKGRQSARYNANIQAATTPTDRSKTPPATQFERDVTIPLGKFLGLYETPEQEAASAARRAQIYGESGQVASGDFTRRGFNPAAAKQLGGASGSRPAVFNQLGEVFDFALQRGLDPAVDYLHHVARRDKLTEQQAKELEDLFFARIYHQKAFDKGIDSGMISDPAVMSRYREVGV
jgi:hypothetical protein